MAMCKIIGAVVSERKRPAKPDVGDDAFVRHGLTGEIWEMLERCWSCDPHSRPDAYAVVRILSQNRGADDGQLNEG